MDLIKMEMELKLFRSKKRKVSLHVYSRICIGCEMCLHCRRNVFGMIYEDNDCYATVEFPENCTACGKCVKRCPSSAIELIKLD